MAQGVAFLDLWANMFNSGQRKSSGNMHKKDLCPLRELCLGIWETGEEAVTGIERWLGQL